MARLGRHRQTGQETRKLTLGAICVLSADDLRFARVVYHESPECRLELLVAEGSTAAKGLADARTAVQRQPVVDDESATAASVQTPMIRMDGDSEGDIEVTLSHPL